ncbi:DUF4870 domain-containing protein [Irregularibacter muris]|uniref:DUF4870 domain-containing protein n=1 Tax=Irregularibacter muris TaxID=1796619 RepID=A0AAE3HD69_9FIRM|nr:DUF4870 domain-containing protein [Irregularibacter muris]MCR1897776.1 DUF4870 domain-containing protein [Irregularibacter muris]
MLTSEQKILALISHLGIFVGFPILAPLLILLLSQDDIIKIQAKEALVFQLGLVILTFIGKIFIILLIGIPILIFVGIITVVCPIVAAVSFIKNGYYSYPITGELAKKL